MHSPELGNLVVIIQFVKLFKERRFYKLKFFAGCGGFETKVGKPTVEFLALKIVSKSLYYSVCLHLSYISVVDLSTLSPPF